ISLPTGSRSLRKTAELDLVPKLLGPTVWPKLHELMTEGSTKGPVIIEFDPTTACNFTCPECISIGLLNKGQIKPQRVRQLLQEFSKCGVRGVIFIGGGEPLAHVSMPEPIVQAHELGMAVGLTTNGSLVNRHLSAIAECVQWTRFSIDAATAHTFAVFRPSHVKNAFEKVISNIELLAKIKKGKIGYSFLLLKRRDSAGEINNYEEVFEAGRLAKEIGCDYFELKPAVDFAHHLIPLSEQDRTQILRQIEALTELDTPNFRVIFPSSLEHLLSSRSTDQPKSYQTCPTLELRTVVTPTGIYPCPYKRGYEESVLASINDPFDRAWVSQERISRSKSINPSVDCAFHCIRHDTNLFIHGLDERGFERLPQSYTIDDDVFI
ncbi:MAG: radical SAM protein, partial [Pyrinomonadaceae bacterium]